MYIKIQYLDSIGIPQKKKKENKKKKEKESINAGRKKGNGIRNWLFPQSQFTGCFSNWFGGIHHRDVGWYEKV